MPAPSPSSLDSSVLLTNGLSSAAAGIVGRCLTHPLDTAKARLQASSTITVARSNSWKILAHTLRTEGFRGWYRGFGVVVTLGTPGTVLYLSTYEVAKHKLSFYRQQQQAYDNSSSYRLPDWAVHLASGMLAETIACIVYVPVDVVKERMQVQQAAGGSSFYYKNTVDAMQQIAKTEGLRGLYRGYAATLASFGPFSALYFVFYEQCKDWASHYEGKTSTVSSSAGQQSISFQSTVLCSATAGAAASWITSPLDLAKLRLQVSRGQQSQQGSPTAYRGVVDCLQQAFRLGGVRGLFRGAFARVLHFCPATTITMTSYESCRSVVANLLPVDNQR
jgi:hypothetical protein